VTRAVMDAVVRLEAVTLGLLAEGRHLFVDEIAVAAGGAGAGTRRGHARSVQMGVRVADRDERNNALGLRLDADNRLEVHFDELVGKLLRAQKIEQRGIALNGGLVEV